jgi:hypothetical protein
LAIPSSKGRAVISEQPPRAPPEVIPPAIHHPADGNRD